MTSLRANTSGSTIVRATAGSQVTVQATRHYWTSNQAPDIKLVPADGVLLVETPPVGFGNPSYTVDYVIDAPTTFGVDLRSASGGMNVTGLGGPVRIESASGAIGAHDLQGSPPLLHRQARFA